jgi:Na+/H+ antiporter NhaD/arsenite permease-like protein
MTQQIVLSPGHSGGGYRCVITEWMPHEVLALLVLGVLALTGLVSPIEALAGFSNPAVVTIWAVFILSGGLTRTGIANTGAFPAQGGRQQDLPPGDRHHDNRAGILSSFMNNIAVAALMLPVVMDIARKTGNPLALADAPGLRHPARRPDHHDRDPAQYPGQRGLAGQ